MPRYIVVASPSYGGAEKRFFDIYTGLRRRGNDIFYVAPSSLIERLEKDHPERRDVFAGLVTVPLDRWSAVAFIRRYRRVLRGLPRGSAFHYPMNCLWPLHFGRRDSVSMSYVDCKNVPRLFTRILPSAASYLAFRFARKIDVLSPAMFELVEASPVGRKALQTPGGTFLLPPATIELAKEPVAAFLGRLIEDKGIRDLMRIVPNLWEAVRGRVPQDFRLLVAGYGPLQGEVAADIERLAARGIPIEFRGYMTAHELMQRAAVILSLQQLTNYPSRVVAEGLAAGCGVIVRNTGDSTQFGELPGLVYCRDPLDAVDIAESIATLLARIVGKASFCREISAAALKRFHSEDYLRYFDALISA